MGHRWLTVSLCLLAVVGTVLSLGCATAFTEERRERRQYAVREDVRHMSDDVEWLLGLDGRSTLYDDSYTPYQ